VGALESEGAAAGILGVAFIGRGGEESHDRKQWPLMAMGGGDLDFHQGGVGVLDRQPTKGSTLGR
jgi:hypothetical protein